MSKQVKFEQLRVNGIYFAYNLYPISIQEIKVTDVTPLGYEYEHFDKFRGETIRTLCAKYDETFSRSEELDLCFSKEDAKQILKNLFDKKLQEL